MSARELEYTNQLLNATQQAAVDAVSAILPHSQRRPDAPVLQRGATIEEDTLKSLSNNNSLSDNLLLPAVLPKDSTSSTSSSTSLKQRQAKAEDSVNRTDDDLISSCQIPTVVENMSVYAYQDIVSGPLAQWLALSAKIGGDVATQAEFVRKAFE